MIKYIALGALFASLTMAELSSSNIDSIPVQIAPQCSVKIELSGLDGVTGFQTDDSNYADLKVSLDTTGNLKMTTTLDLANSKLCDDLQGTNPAPINTQPIVWSLKYSDAGNTYYTGDASSIDTTDTDYGIFMQHTAGTANVRVNNTNTDDASYYDHRVRMLNGVTGLDLTHITNANNIESNANKQLPVNLSNLLIKFNDNGVLKDADDTWETAYNNPQIIEKVLTNAKIDFNYKLGYHFVLGAIGSDADKFIKLVVNTTVLDLPAS